MSRRIVVTGATGQIGRPLCAGLIRDGWEVTVLSRRPHEAAQIVPGAHDYLDWGPEQTTGTWTRTLDGADAVVALAGAPFFRRWKSREELERVGTGGRVTATRNLVNAMREAATPPAVFVTGSAVGFYGFTGDDTPVTERTPQGTDGWAAGTAAWEAEASTAEEFGVRTVMIRTGIVLSPDAGMAANMRNQFQRGFGAIILPGTQWLPWIHINDEIGIFRLAIENPQASGPLNASSPNPARYREYAQTMGTVLGKRVPLRLPGLIMRLTLGDVADSVLKNRRMIPERALHLGYHFTHPNLEEALHDLLK